MSSLGTMISSLFPVPLVLTFCALCCKGTKIFLAIFDVSVCSMFFFSFWTSLPVHLLMVTWSMQSLAAKSQASAAKYILSVRPASFSLQSSLLHGSTALEASRSSILLDIDNKWPKQFNKISSRSKVCYEGCDCGCWALFFSSQSCTGVYYTDSALPAEFVKWFLNSPHRYIPKKKKKSISISIYSALKSVLKQHSSIHSLTQL